MLSMKASSSTQSTRGRGSVAVVMPAPSNRQDARDARSCAPGSDPVGYLCSRHGSRNEIALADVASQLRQEVPVVAVLDPFCDHLHLELVRHSQTCSTDGLARPIGGCPMHEAAINLELVERQVAQLRQGGVAGTEIVDRQAEGLEGQPAQHVE